MTTDEQKNKAISDLFQAIYWYWSRVSSIYAVAELCTKKVTRQEVSNVILQWDKEKAQETSEKMRSLYSDAEVLGFILKHKEQLEFMGCDDLRENIINAKPKPVDIKIPIRDMYWVMRRLWSSVRQGQYKRCLYYKDMNVDNPSLRTAFLTVTKYTETNHRKKSQRYTVSRDLDKDAFYISAKGRLAKLPLYKINKYIKQGLMVEDHGELRAKDEIPDGQYVKVGSYLQKYFPKVPKEKREQLQKSFEEIRPCHMVIDTDFKKAYDPIYNNYQDTDGDRASNYSCMSGYGEYAQQFYGGIHGCKIVRWETDKGDQVGRCIMYEYNGQRHFVRIYGLYEYHRTMINLLTNEMKENDLFGRGYSIKDLELETDWTDETKSMYLDGPYGVRRVSREDEQGTWYTKYKVVERGWDFDCKSTSHDTLDYEEDSYYTCEHCGERVHEDDVWWAGDNTYCSEECANNDGWYRCHWCDEWEYQDDGIFIDEYFYCCDACARREGYELCENCGEWGDKERMIEIDGEYYCNEDCAEKQGWHECYHCGDWCDEDGDCTIIIDGQCYCCEECAKADGWVKIGEEWKRAEDVEEVKEQEPEKPKEVVNEG